MLDRYRLQTRLGGGSMGSVWAASHLALEQTVALKFLYIDAQSAPESKQRFMQAGQVSAQMGHISKHLVKVLDHGVVRVRDAGEEVERPFLVLEHLHGESLLQRLHKQGRFSLSQMRPLVRQLARGLAALHRNGVIHGDLRPGNVFLARLDDDDAQGDVVKLLDAGFATGAIGGTPGFMSPELVRGDGVADAHADLWGFVATVYACVVGEPPFGTGTERELTARILWSPVRKPSVVLGRAMPGFDLWVARGLAREPSSRFESANELADAFEAVVIDEDEGARKSAFGGRSEAESRRRWPQVLAVSLFLLAGTAALVWRARANRVPSKKPAGTLVEPTSALPPRPDAARGNAP